MTKPAALVAAVNAALLALVALGVFDLSTDQLAAIGIAVNALSIAVVSIFDPKVPWYGVVQEPSGDTEPTA